MTEGQAPPAGWYPDPAGSGMERWWDGARWSERVRPAGWAPPAGGPGAGWPAQQWQPAAAPPPNHLVWAILTTIFCCLPFGIVAIVKSSQVGSLWAAGDLEGARQASAAARTWSIVSAAASVVVIPLFLIVSIAVLGGEAHDNFEQTELCMEDPAYC